MTSDETWYRQYLDGDETAVEKLVRKYGDVLTLYLHGYVKDMHEAEDLMIEAFSRVFARERPIHGEGSFRAYLFKTARNLAFRHVKKQKFPLLSSQDLIFSMESTVLTETEFLHKERDRQLYDALASLKEEYREVLYLVYFEKMSYREVAAVMKKSEQQVTNLVHRGKQSLKAALEKKGFEYDR